MPEKTKGCQVAMHDGKLCGRELFDGLKCIFHSHNNFSNVERFQEKLNEMFKDEGVEAYDLTGCIFPKGIAFPRRITKAVIFRKSLFNGEANFENVSFEDIAEFIGAIFKDGANFRGAVFENNVEFAFTTFNVEAYFRESTFKGETSFGDTVFEGKAFFADSIFRGHTEFTHATFRDIVDFESATFEDWASFYGVTFNKETYFWNAIFKGDADFWGAIFQDTLRISAEAHEKKGFLGEVSFGSVKFFKPESVIFQKVDLSKFRFLETDLRGVHFIDVNWNKEDNKGRNRVFDEVSPSDNADLPGVREFDHALIAQLYIYLRANYENNLRYSEAGDFYIGEMEMTRKAETSVFRKLPLILYKAISNYGESYYRPLCWILAILLLFPIFFMIAGIQPVNHEQIIVTAEKIKDYSTSFWYSTSIFSFIRDKKCTTINNWGDALFVTESILSPIMLAFLLLALRRRFKR